MASVVAPSAISFPSSSPLSSVLEGEEHEEVEEMAVPIPVEEPQSFSYEEIVEACKQMGLVEELRCVIKTQTGGQCLMTATKKNKDGFPCCSGASHVSSSAKDVFPDPVPCHFIFVREAEQKAGRLHPHEDVEVQKSRCHAKSAKSGNRCFNAIETGDFCSVHQKSLNEYPTDDLIVQCGVNTMKGTPCKLPRVAGADTCTLHMTKKDDGHVHVPVQAPVVVPVPAPTAQLHDQRLPYLPVREGGCSALTQKRTHCSRAGKKIVNGQLFCTQHANIEEKKGYLD